MREFHAGKRGSHHQSLAITFSSKRQRQPLGTWLYLVGKLIGVFAPFAATKAPFKVRVDWDVVLMAFLTGSIGVLMAVPFLAVVPVLVKMFYVEDVLGERVALPGQAEGTS